MDTQVGNIADLLDNQDELDTPIKRKLNAVGKTLTVIGLIVCVLIFLLGALYHRPLIPHRASPRALRPGPAGNAIVRNSLICVKGKRRIGLMKTTGIVRGIDALGRIVLPKELRTSMRLDSDAKLEIFVEGDSIILKKYRPNGSCDFCGEVDSNAVQYEGYCICSACRRKIGAL